MKNFVLDTTVLIQITRGKEKATQVKEFIDGHNEPQLFISVVSIAEAESFVLKQGDWSNQKIQKLRDLFNSFIVIDIEHDNKLLLESYSQIDSYSQGKSRAPDGQLLNNSSRNMGKNDLWIAATTHALDAVLVTFDKDFEHLNKIYFEVKIF